MTTYYTGEDKDLFYQFFKLLVGESDEPFTKCTISDAAETWTATVDQPTLGTGGNSAKRYFIFSAHGGATRSVEKIVFKTDGGFTGFELDVSAEGATWAGTDQFKVEHYIGMITTTYTA